MLSSNSTLNSLTYLNQVQITAGETATILFQFVDLDTVNQQNLIGNRYMACGSSPAPYVNITICSNNDANVIKKIASQPFSCDDSIWSFNMTTLETAAIGSINLSAVLIEGASVKIAQGNNVIIGSQSCSFQC
jgi:hypothetical protein